jgi:hypothetical protein
MPRLGTIGGGGASTYGFSRVLDGSSQSKAAKSALEIWKLGRRTDGYYWINVSGTPRYLHCLLSSTFATGFYSGNSGRAGWTLFAQRATAIGDIDITTTAGSPDTSGAGNFAFGSWKQGFDAGASFSTETEILVDVDGTHSFIYDGWRGIARSLANAQVAIVRGYTGGNAVMAASDFNGTTFTVNTPGAGCTSCFRPRYKNQNASFGYVNTNGHTNSGNGTACSDWCADGYGLIYSQQISPQLSRTGGCFGNNPQFGYDSCGYQGVQLSATGTTTRFYFRERPV